MINDFAGALGVWPGRQHGLQQELPLTHTAPGRVVQAAEERLHVLTAPVGLEYSIWRGLRTVIIAG